MQPSIDTKRLNDFLDEFAQGMPVTLCAYRGDRCKAIQTCADTASATAFVNRHNSRAVRIALGTPGIPGKEPSFDNLSAIHFVAMAVPLFLPGPRGKPPVSSLTALDRYEAPTFYLEHRAAPEHAVAAWRFMRAETQARAKKTIENFAKRFSEEQGVTAVPLLTMMPVPTRMLKQVNAQGWRGTRLGKNKIHTESFAPKPHEALAAAGTSAPLTEQGRRLRDALREFEVAATVIGVQTGPVITLYNLKLGTGTKASKLTGAAKDIARAMKCKSARVVEASSDGTIGIEIPNAKRETVYLRDVLASSAFKNSEATLPLALGKAANGDPVVVDLAPNFHMLVAGATGSGKSVGLNSMILSLLAKLPPERLSLIMIDPKMIELSVYSEIAHMAAPVITEPEQAVKVLKWVVSEMTLRYRLMSKLGVRNLASYNEKSPERLAHIVVIIDEVADLMMVAGKEVEYSVQRLSQMARAAGIHLIMATQRPTVDVITGTIKANLPGRITFRVTSQTDSRTIIDGSGAEQLLGKGDMLYKAADADDLMRVHGALVTDDEVAAEVRKIKGRWGAPHYRQDILDLFEAGENGSGAVERVGAPMINGKPKPVLSATVSRYAAALQAIFTPGGQPLEGPVVRRAIESAGLTWGANVYTAADALQIHRPAERGSFSTPKPWTPPSEWPDAFAV